MGWGTFHQCLNAPGPCWVQGHGQEPGDGGQGLGVGNGKMGMGACESKAIQRPSPLIQKLPSGTLRAHSLWPGPPGSPPVLYPPGSTFCSLCSVPTAYLPHHPSGDPYWSHRLQRPPSSTSKPPAREGQQSPCFLLFVFKVLTFTTPLQREAGKGAKCKEALERCQLEDFSFFVLRRQWEVFFVLF